MALADVHLHCEGLVRIFRSKFVVYLAVDDAEVAECMLAATRIGDDAENTYGELDKAVAAS
jgi:hypothetical protein